MSFFVGLIPTELSTSAAIAICAIALVSGTARGFSGFGSALIFMPLASSMAVPRLVAALFPDRADHRADAIRFSLLVGPVYAIGVLIGAALFGRASERLFRGICYALIAAAVIIGLPALDGMLR